MSDLKAAEAALLALEKYKHATMQAWHALKQAEYSGDPNIIEPAQKAWHDAVAAEKAADIDDRDIDRAAALVLALRGEAHTEQGVLPPDHGLRTVLAEKALAAARAAEVHEGKTGLVAQAEKDLEAARALDLEEKTAHMTDSHDRTQAEHTGE